jgi:tripartite-type tricarboxylate transporter receptor subunit TctC
MKSAFCMVAAFAIVVLAGAAESFAQAYPAKPVRIIDGFPPGGATTFIARVFGERLAERIGQPLIVDNRPGAGSNLGAAIAAKATPDGYTLFIALTSTLAPAPSLYAHLDYNLLNDFSYVGMLATGAFVLVVHPSVPIRTVTELVAYAKSKPRELRYGSGGIATPLHLAMELLRGATGMELIHVPYKGAGPLVVALTGGEIQLGFSSVAGAIPMIKSGRLRAIAVAGARRAKVLPEVPTVEESGIAKFDVTGRYGLLAPLGTPAAIVRRLNVETAAVGALSEVESKLETVGIEAATSTPDGFRQIMRNEIAQWAKVIKDANITPID